MKYIKKLNFGSGQDYREGWVNADLEGADLNFDFEVFPYPIADATYDYIYTAGVLDHLKDFFSVMRELHRILKPGGVLKINVPFYNCQTSWYPTHFNHFTFMHFYSFDPEHRKTFTVENKSDVGEVKFKIEIFKTVPGILGKLVPELKGNRPSFRYFLGMVFGEVVERLEVEMVKL